MSNLEERFSKLEDRVSELERVAYRRRQDDRERRPQKRERSTSPRVFDTKTAVRYSEDCGIHVSRIPQNTTLVELRAYFSGFGEIVFLRAHPTLEWANVFFETKNARQDCLLFNHQDFRVSQYIRRERF